MVTIHLEVFIDRAVFEQKLEQLLSKIKPAKAIAPAKPVLLPGELEYQCSVQRRREGIPIAFPSIPHRRHDSKQVA